MDTTKDSKATDARINNNKIHSCIRGFVVFINHPAFRGTLEFVALTGFFH